MGTRPLPAPEIGTQDRQRKKNISVNSSEVKSAKIPSNLQNRGSNLSRMGVEQKPLYVTQVDKLEAKIQALCHASLVGRQSSYSPYSQVSWYLAFHRIKLRKLLQEYVIFQFSVGAALLCADGTTVLGCNVENASYGLAICAERTAAVKAVSGGQQDFVAIAIAAHAGEQFVGPCGACRQFMAEFNPDIPIYLVRPDLEVQVTNLNVLLPEAFTPRVRLFFTLSTRKHQWLVWHIFRGWISSSTAMEQMEPMEPTKPMEPMEPMEQCENMLKFDKIWSVKISCNLKSYKQMNSITREWMTHHNGTNSYLK